MRVLLFTAIAALGCAGEVPESPESTDTPDGGPPVAPNADGTSLEPDAMIPRAPDAAAPGKLLGTFELTYYWVTFESDFTGPADTDVFDPSCAVLATVPSAFAAALTLEGTGKLEDGRLLNYSGPCGCAYSPCFFVVDQDHPWGYGVQNRALVPFRSLAVDRDVIPYGTPLYVAELDGFMMPGSLPWGDFVHDGCMNAADTGGAISGHHIDFFVALHAYYLDIAGRLGLGEVTVYDGGGRCP